MLSLTPSCSGPDRSSESRKGVGPLLALSSAIERVRAWFGTVAGGRLAAKVGAAVELLRRNKTREWILAAPEHDHDIEPQSVEDTVIVKLFPDNALWPDELYGTETPHIISPPENPLIIIPLAYGRRLVRFLDDNPVSDYRQVERRRLQRTLADMDHGLRLDRSCMAPDLAGGLGCGLG